MQCPIFIEKALCHRAIFFPYTLSIKKEILIKKYMIFCVLGFKIIL